MITSWVFWAVLLTATVVHWLLPTSWRMWFLTVASIGYLGFEKLIRTGETSDLLSVGALLLWSAAFYFAGQRLHGKPRFVTLILILGVLLYLGYFKYFPSLYQAIRGANPNDPIAAVVVPLGASYYTFKLIHYIVETSRGNVTPHPPDVFLAYMFFFPMFTAGPIERFDDFRKNRSEKLTLDHAVDGITRIIYGLIKKLVIVDLILSRQMRHDPHNLVEAIPIWNPSYPLEELLRSLPTVHPAFVWQFVITQFVSVYLDFSAYSDIAIGAGLLLGVRLMENFEYPLLATNLSDFWRRWHISLTSWCQQYVYLPVLGRTRNPYIAVFMTMGAIGIWHAGTLNYLCWGIFQAVCLVIYLSWGRLKRKRKWKIQGVGIDIFGGVVTFLTVSAAQAFVSTQALGIRAALGILLALVGIHPNRGA